MPRQGVLRQDARLTLCNTACCGGLDMHATEPPYRVQGQSQSCKQVRVRVRVRVRVGVQCQTPESCSCLPPSSCSTRHRSRNHRHRMIYYMVSMPVLSHHWCQKVLRQSSWHHNSSPSIPVSQETLRTLPLAIAIAFALSLTQNPDTNTNAHPNPTSGYIAPTPTSRRDYYCWQS